MSEEEIKEVENKVTTEAESSAVDSQLSDTPKKKSMTSYVVSILVVVLIIGGVLFVMEKQGRSSTGVFDSMLAKQEANKVVATVNGEEITNSELATSIQQFSQAATAQGVDTTSLDVQSEIRNQSLEVLINTELLKQAAADKGIEVSEEEAASRLATISEEIGGPDVLAERMAILGVDEEKLQQDIRDELMIQELLDSVFAEANIIVTEEEINSVYENAGGVEAGLPALEEVRAQIEAQIKSSKEQEVVDAYLSELKSAAEVEVI